MAVDVLFEADGNGRDELGFGGGPYRWAKELLSNVLTSRLIVEGVTVKVLSGGDFTRGVETIEVWNIEGLCWPVFIETISS